MTKWISALCLSYPEEWHNPAKVKHFDELSFSVGEHYTFSHHKQRNLKAQPYLDIALTLHGQGSKGREGGETEEHDPCPTGIASLAATTPPRHHHQSQCWHHYGPKTMWCICGSHLVTNTAETPQISVSGLQSCLLSPYLAPGPPPRKQIHRQSLQSHIIPRRQHRGMIPDTSALEQAPGIQCSPHLRKPSEDQADSRVYNKEIRDEASPPRLTVAMSTGRQPKQHPHIPLPTSHWCAHTAPPTKYPVDWLCAGS